MKIKNFIMVFAFTFFIVQLSSAQRGVCGVSLEDQEVIVEQIKAFKKNPVSLENRGAMDMNVALAFTLVGRTDGSGKVRRSALLNQMARMNRDFENMGIKYYLHNPDDIGYELNSNTAYTNARNSGGLFNSREAGDAINVFVAESDVPNPSSFGTVLGYWTGQFDHLFLRISEAEANTSTLSHEIGHFFNLAHTHRGWDAVACNWRDADGNGQNEWDETFHGNPLRSGTSPGGVPVERADGSNCEIAGDLLCDTPADYNFGISNPNNCVFSRNQKDHVGDEVDPQEENYMGYFNGCADYVFSPMQEEMMLSSYNSSGRNYIRSTYVPISDELVGEATIISPENRAELDYYDQIQMEWEAVVGATHYLIEMTANSIGFDEYFITTEPNLFFDELEPDTRYSYRIYPYNEGNAEFGTIRLQRFTTGNLSVGVNDVAAIESLNVYPNPLQLGQDLSVALNANNNFDAQVKLTALDGRIVYQAASTFTAGSNIQKINTQDLTSGLYIISIETPQGVSQKKVMIK